VKWFEIALGVVALSVAAFILAAWGLAERRADRLETAITEPETGWSARLAQCNTSLAGAERGVAVQNAAMAALRLDSNRRLEAAERAEADSARRAEDLERRVSALMSRGHTATDPYERVLEGRAWILEDLQ
jgi:hypothetical protein